MSDSTASVFGLNLCHKDTISCSIFLYINHIGSITKFIPSHSLSSQHVVEFNYLLVSELVKLMCIISQAIQPPIRKTLLLPSVCQLGVSHTVSVQQNQAAESVDSSLVTP